MLGIRTHVARSLAACVFASLAATLVACARDASSAAERPSIRFRVDTGQAFGDVEVFPVSRAALAGVTNDEWPSVLSVHVGDTSALAMLGTYSVSADTLRFRPRFPPAAGATYIARFDSRVLPASGDSSQRYVLTETWRAPGAAGASTTVVTGIYPTTGDVPMNLLRMYVEFSAPMSTGRSYDHIRLYAEGDSLLEEPFFTAGGAVELWDPEKRRLTILFDPGRIKRDLRPNEELGLPLRQGKRYRLVIDSAWRDAQGRALVRGHEKRLRVMPADRSLVRTTDWTVFTPRAGTREPLVLVFPESLDRALLERLLVVRDSSGRTILGEIALSARETRWSFTPRDAWAAMPHYVDVDTELEDLAGNNLRRLFDVAPGDSSALGVNARSVRLPFSPRSR